MKAKVFFTSKVFSVNEIGSNNKIDEVIRFKIQSSWKTLKSIAIIKFAEKRFPNSTNLQEQFNRFNPHVIGCHLSHPITQKMQKNPNLFAIATSTVGYNHIERLREDKILVTHTPGVLHETVADYTIALILANLRNLIDLHEYVWQGKWSSHKKWDLDQKLSSMIKNKIIGIVGLGEIGSEVLKLLYPWGVKIIYYDIRRRNKLEQEYPDIKFVEELNIIFKNSDIISLHIPLNKQTQNLISKDLLKLMKKDSLLINTARGGILDLFALLELLESGKSKINFALDVFPSEPLDKKTLKRIKTIKRKNPEIRILLLPHNASSDANTRGKMVNLFLSDIIKLIQSRNTNDLENIHIIPEQKKLLSSGDWKIKNYWNYIADTKND